MRSALPSQIGGSQEPDNEPNHAVVLMQGHGFTTVAHGIEVGESSVICDDATNFPENYAKRLAKPQIPLDQMLF